LRLEDAFEIDALAQRRPDLAPVVGDDLHAVAPRHLRPEPGYDDVRMGVDDSCHLAGARCTVALISSRGSCPRSSSITTAALRPGPPVTEPPGCVVAPVWYRPGIGRRCVAHPGTGRRAPSFA